MVTAAERIAAAKSRRISKVDVGGEEFFVRRLPADVVMEITRAAREGKQLSVAEWLAFGVCNEDGSAYFTDEEAAEYSEAAGVDAVRLADAVADKAGLGPESAAKN
jgi:hypothetical protein